MGDYGARIKAAREAANLTQEQLGEKIGVTGVTIMRYEKNQREPRINQVNSIADALGISPSYLMGCMSDDGTTDLGLVAIELSKIVGIDRMIVLDVLEEIDLENPFSEETIEEVKKKAGKRKGKTTGSKFDISKFAESLEVVRKREAEKPTRGIVDKYLDYFEWAKTYEVEAAIEIEKTLKNLNEVGQREAVKRIAELAEIPKYQKKEPSPETPEGEE